MAILFSHDSLAGDVAPDSQPALYPTRYYLPPPPPPAEPAQIDAGGRAHPRRAQRPVIIAGNGVRIAQAYEQLQQLAETAGLPVATTAAGKGAFPETHPLALGVFGTFGTPAANACIGEADLVLVVGSKLSPSDTAWDNRKLLDPTRQIFHPDRHRAAQRLVDLPGRARAARRRRDGPRRSCSRRSARAAPGAPREARAAGRRRIARRTAISTHRPISPTTSRSCRSG